MGGESRDEVGQREGGGRPQRRGGAARALLVITSDAAAGAAVGCGGRGSGRRAGGRRRHSAALEQVRVEGAACAVGVATDWHQGLAASRRLHSGVAQVRAEAVRSFSVH